MTTWATTTIGAACATYSGGTPSTAHPEYYGGDIPWIASAELNQGRISSVKGRISKLGLERSAAKMVEPGNPLIALYGATAGVPAITRIGGAINQAVLAMVPRGVDGEFLYQWLRANRDQIIDRYTQGGQPNLSGAIVRSIEIPLPPMAEQKRVADTLRNADDLIATLERLIAKKQAIKQGMMQQLLTGRTRLPGFTSEWRSASLGDVLTVRHGKNQRAVEVPSGPYPILATGGQIGWAREPLCTKPSVLIGRKGTIDKPQYQDRPFWTVDTLFYTEISPTADPRYLYYLFLTVDWRSMNEASGVPSLNSSRIESVERNLPDLPEQIAIREVLDDADREISALEARLVKARSIKTGMMQQLLTGRTRLPVEVAS